jgi:hypothetical protein
VEEDLFVYFVMALAICNRSLNWLPHCNHNSSNRKIKYIRNFYKKILMRYGADYLFG